MLPPHAYLAAPGAVPNQPRPRLAAQQQRNVSAFGVLGRHHRAAKKKQCWAKRVACGRPLTLPSVAADLPPDRNRRRQLLWDLGRPVWCVPTSANCRRSWRALNGPSRGSHIMQHLCEWTKTAPWPLRCATVLARYPRAAWRGVVLSTAAAGPRGSALFLAGTPASGT